MTMDTVTSGLLLPPDWQSYLYRLRQSDYFRPLGWSPRFQEPVWPIEEYLARVKHKPKVAARIRRLNPDGRGEGEIPRGWHPHARSRLTGDNMRVCQFVRRFGSAAFQKLPRSAFVKRGGRRRRISVMYIFEHVSRMM